ncbi:hypothetical protein MD484_g8087, partial [Candolleomyces efflorescens]
MEGPKETEREDEWNHYRDIVYLHVEIGEFWGVVYPDGDEDSESEASEASSQVGASDSEGAGNEEQDEEDEGTDSDSGVQVGDEDDQEASDLIEERAYDFMELSEMELAEIAEDHAFIIEDEAKEDSAHTWFDGIHSAQELSILLTFSPTPLARIEFVVYSALRRLLEACAPTLEVLSISWKPISSFFIEAVFPLLPKLQVLRLNDDRSGHAHFEHSLSHNRVKEAPVIFPALQHLDVKFNDALSTLEVQDILSMSPNVQIISLPHANR